MLKFKNLVVFFAFVLTMFGFSIDINEVRNNQELSHTKGQVVAVVDIGFTFKTAEARDRIFSDLDRASRRVVDRTRDRIVRDTEHNIQRRINDHIRDQAELLDPSSRTYQEFKCKNLINSLPYGVTRVLVQGSIDSAHAPGCVFLERQHMRLLERIIRDYSNVVIANDCYKMARNGRRGEWIGYDIQKVYDVNEIIVTDDEPVRRRR